MTDKQKYAIKLAINTMDKHFGRHYNTAYCNRDTGVNVSYGEAINILSDMLSNAGNHICNYQNDGNPRDNEHCCRCNSLQTNADRIRNMSDEELACVIEKIKMCGGLIRTETTSAECNGCKDGYCCNVMQWLQSEAE